MSRLLLLLVSTALLSACEAPPGRVPAVILKLDDLREENGTAPDGWRDLFAALDERGIPATIGLIGNSLENGSEEYYAWIRAQDAAGHEVWNHGYCHCRTTGAAGDEVPEFAGTDADYQLDHLRRTQALALKHLGLTLHSFGAPYNATDSVTTTVLADLPEPVIWLYPHGGAETDKFVLPRTPGLNIEYPTHQPNFAKFRAVYEANREAEIIVLQGHPRSWTDHPERRAEFDRILEYLVAQGTRFTTPYAHYLAQRRVP